MCVVRQGEGGDFFKYRGVDNYGLNECSQSASLRVCKKKKAQLKPLQGRLITPRKRGNINGRFCGYNVTAKWLHRPRHVRRSHGFLSEAPCRPLQMYVRVWCFYRWVRLVQQVYSVSVKSDIFYVAWKWSQYLSLYKDHFIYYVLLMLTEGCSHRQLTRYSARILAYSSTQKAPPPSLSGSSGCYHGRPPYLNPPPPPLCSPAPFSPAPPPPLQASPLFISPLQTQCILFSCVSTLKAV